MLVQVLLYCLLVGYIRATYPSTPSCWSNNSNLILAVSTYNPASLVRGFSVLFSHCRQQLDLWECQSLLGQVDYAEKNFQRENKTYDFLSFYKQCDFRFNLTESPLFITECLSESAWNPPGNKTTFIDHRSSLRPLSYFKSPIDSLLNGRVHRDTYISVANFYVITLSDSLKFVKEHYGKRHFFGLTYDRCEFCGASELQYWCYWNKTRVVVDTTVPTTLSTSPSSRPRTTGDRPGSTSTSLPPPTKPVKYHINQYIKDKKWTLLSLISLATFAVPAVLCIKKRLLQRLQTWRKRRRGVVNPSTVTHGSITMADMRSRKA